MQEKYASFFYQNLSSISGGFTSGLGLTSQKDSNGVKLIATADCLYPYYPFVDVMYSYQVKMVFKKNRKAVYCLKDYVY